MGEVRSPSQRARSGKQALQEGWEDLGGPPGELGRVERPSRRPGRGREGWEKLGVHPRGLGGLGRPSSGMEGLGRPSSGMGVVGRPSRWAGRGWEERERMGGSLRGLGGVWGSFRKAVRDCECWRRSGVPPGGPGRVGRSSRRAGRGREALPESRDR